MIPDVLCNVIVIVEGHRKPQKDWDYMAANAYANFKGYYQLCGHRKSLISLTVSTVTIFQFYSFTTNGEMP